MKVDPKPATVETHRLHPLLCPRSIALVGASPRPGSVGNQAARALLDSGFGGRLTFINSRHAEVEGKACLASLAEVDEAPDLAVLNVGAQRLEQALLEAIEFGARAAVIFDNCFGIDADGTPLVGRLRSIAREANLPVCGGNGMGFFNIPDRCHASFYSAGHLKPGGISLIAHSGSVFTVLALNDSRYRFDLVVSPGQEIGATIDEYVDYAARRSTTRVIALFMETARDPQGFARALQAARAHGTVVVVCKVGRSEESARLARSHSGALAGNDAAYEALFERCGALSVETVDELMNVSMMLAAGRVPADGETALVTDSGGLRELLIDRADARDIPLARLSEATCARLQSVLPSDLPASNPLDCAAVMSDRFARVFEDGLGVLAGAPEVGIVGYEFDARDDHVYNPELLQIAHRLPLMIDKPCFAYSSFARADNRRIADQLLDAGLPLVNGLDEMLSVIAGLRRLRELRQQAGAGDASPPGPPQAIVEKWEKELVGGSWHGEAAGLALLRDFGIPATASITCSSLDEVAAVARDITYPVVLKTAAPGIAHKSDVGGVVTGLAGNSELEAAYREMAERLGPDVLIQEMAAAGVELAFGYVRDPEFGPLVMLAAGGTMIEIVRDRQFALAPFGPGQADRMLRSLKIFPLLAGTRGRPPCDLEAVRTALARFSVMCAALEAQVSELDANPVIVTPDGVIAVDALIGCSMLEDESGN